MELKSTISGDSNNLAIQKITKVTVQTFGQKEYEQMFNKLLQINILDGKFKDNIWKVFEKLQDMPVEFSFEVGTYNHFQYQLKSYVLLKLQSKVAPMTIYNELQNIKKCILNSDGLTNLQLLEVFLTDEYLKSENNGGRISNNLKKFILFIDLEDKKELIKVCSFFPLKKRLNRELPNLHDVLIFDEIINDYFRNYDIEHTFRYLPVMLWWLITNIIPQRPSEFLLLRKDCLSSKIIDGEFKFFITVSRIKDNPGSNEIEIDEATYKIIEKYRNIITVNLNNDSPYLFTIDFYYHNKNRKISRRKSNERLNRRDFYTLLDDFYNKVVKSIYQVESIERVKFGDTRHFAIINMCLQGFNMLSVANMAGHKKIYSQNEYFSHAKHFATSYVYIMAQKKLEYSFSKNISGGLVGWKRYMYDRGKSISFDELDFDKIIGKVHYGVCSELQTEFPKNCIADCRFCNKYYFRPSITEFDEAMEWLINSSDQLKIKIENAIELMREIVTNSLNDQNKAIQNLLQTTSRNLVNYMDLKATVDSKILESDLNHGF